MKFMGKPYSHCAYLFTLYGVELVLEASILGGVRIVTVDHFMKNTKIAASYAVSDERGLALLKYGIKNLGDKYGFWSIVGIALGVVSIGKDGGNTHICSELIARGLGLQHHDLDHITVDELEELLKADQ